MTFGGNIRKEILLFSSGLEPTRIKAEASSHEDNIFVGTEPTQREEGRYIERQQALVVLSAHPDSAMPVVFSPLVFSV